MNDLAPAGIGDNSETSFNDFNAKFKTIEQSVRKAHERSIQYDQQLSAALADTLDLGLMLEAKQREERDEDWSFFKGLLHHYSKKWSPKSEKNIFHELVSIGFDKLDADGEPITSAPNMSKYRMILRYAQLKDWDGEQLNQELLRHTLTDVYKAAVAYLRRDPLEKYLENTQDRYERAVAVFDETVGLPEGTWTDAISRPQNANIFATAVLRLTDSGYQIVSVAEGEQGDDVKRTVAALVPAAAPRSSQKLADQNLYWLFVACDFYRRFQSSPTNQTSFAEAEKKAGIPTLKMDPSDDEIAEHLNALAAHGNRRTEKIRKNNESLASLTADEIENKFVLLNALCMSFEAGRWVAESRTTLAHEPCVQVVLNRKIQHLRTSKKHWIKDVSARAFALDFPSFESWNIIDHEAGLQIATESTLARSCVLGDYSGLANWKELDPTMNTLCTFAVSAEVLGSLARWRADEKAKGSFTRKAFQGTLKLGIQGENLVLIFPNDPDRFRVLGELVEGSSPEIVSDRFLDFTLIETMVSWAKDYGSTFEISVLNGHQGWTALRIKAIGHPMDVQVTVPVLISHKGAPTEINLPCVHSGDGDDDLAEENVAAETNPEVGKP
ncbi:hypothetical protein [Thalassobius sp. I31.1]|uniref:hypothetical protein n=1 Tax=Thalassobius sp. I31.1 TaxID=2109912 RepID=UPI000D1A98BE|nr:hypothetical protein [Thalassobius sp. I31.1]